MRPIDLQTIGDELAIKWPDARESYVKLSILRRRCPCAGCAGEMDVMGNVYKAPAQELGPSAFQLRGLPLVGGYAVQPIWGDGHSTGIYSWEYLKRIAESTTAG
jgi:DUF971 family protein